MIWPSPQDYNEAVQVPLCSFADSELQHGSPDLNVLGLPRPNTGYFASVYKMHCAERDVAVRCFLHPVRDQQYRYAQVSQFLAQAKLPYMVEFDYMQKGIRINDQWYPILKMEWCDGIPLHQYLNDAIEEPSKIRKLAENFRVMMLDLHEAGIAHGDLQHGNILVQNGELRLVDYDGMFVPALAGLQSNELGHRNYQHPRRSNEHFGPYLDNFSSWLIVTALEALAENPGLWQEYNGGDDKLLFSTADLRAPHNSKTFRRLRLESNAESQIAIFRTTNLLKMQVEEVPPIHMELVVLQAEPDPIGADELANTSTSKTIKDILEEVEPKSLDEVLEAIGFPDFPQPAPSAKTPPARAWSVSNPNPARVQILSPTKAGGISINWKVVCSITAPLSLLLTFFLSANQSYACAIVAGIVSLVLAVLAGVFENNP